MSEIIKSYFAFDSQSIVEVQSCTTSENFVVNVRTKFNTNVTIDFSQCAQRWISEFSKATCTNWIVCQTFPSIKRWLFKKTFKCHHNFRNKGKSGSKHRPRNLKCQACIIIAVKKITKDSIKNDSFLKDGLNVCIKIHFNHTHSVNVAEAYGLLRVENYTKEAYMEYFKMGMNPAAAHAFHEIKLTEDNDEFSGVKKLANAQINPRKRQIYTLYNQWRDTNFGSRDPLDAMKLLIDQQDEFSKMGVEIYVDKENRNVAIVTPIMRRAHAMTFSNEIVFVDSTGSCDQANTVVTFLFGSSKVGGIPLGCVLHTQQTEENYSKALGNLKNLIGPAGFNGKGHPLIFMTDDSAAERKALHTIFPESILLLCIFHITQAVWRWLLQTTHGIPKTDRQHLMQMFKHILYAHTKEECELAIENFRDNSVCNKYRIYLDHIENLLKRSDEWCLYKRARLLTRGNDTNNIVEVSIRIFKDIALERCKAFNICALVHFVTNVLENHHKKRLLNFANGRDTSNNMAYGKLLQKSNQLKVEAVDSNTFYVSSESNEETKYKVLIDLQLCDCIAGQGGKFCKHLCAIQELHGNIATTPELNTNDRVTLAKLAIGNLKESDVSFFDSMQAGPSRQSDNYVAQLLKVEGENKNEGVAVECNIEDTGEEYKKEARRFFENQKKMESLINEEDHTILNVLKKMNDKLDSVKTTSQLGSFFSNIVSRSQFKRRIAVQPTSLSRRQIRPGLKAGNRRIQAGRPSKHEVILNGKVVKRRQLRRQHNLSAAIKANLANAKGH